MDSKPLSGREEEIVQLAIEGYTNESIAQVLGISVSTVNTYWVRIRMKVHGDSRTAVVARLITDKADQALVESNLAKAELADEIVHKHAAMLDLHAALALLRLAMDHMQSAVWATGGPDLTIQIVANGEIPPFKTAASWIVGNTIYEMFGTTDRKHPAIDAHFRALKGENVELHLDMGGESLLLMVNPLAEEGGEVIGCIGVLARNGKAA